MIIVAPSAAGTMRTFPSCFKTYNQRRILRVVARLGHGHLALVDAAGPRAAGVDPVAVRAAGDVEVVVIPRHLYIVKNI